MEEKFVLTAPAILKLPEGKFYDETQPTGWKCAWSIIWEVCSEDGESTKFIHPNQWRVNGNGAPDLEKFPTEFLRRELEDLSCRENSSFSAKAAQLYFQNPPVTEGDESAYRTTIIELLNLVRSVPPTRQSTYNPPSENRLKKVSLRR